MAKKKNKNEVEEIKLDTSQFNFTVPDEAVISKLRDLEGLSAEMYQQDKLKSRADALEGDLRSQKDLLEQREKEFQAQLEAERSKSQVVEEKKSLVNWPLIIGAVLILIAVLGVLYWRLVVVTNVPEPEPEPVVNVEPEPEPEPEPTGPVQGNDADSDGLTDIEERLYFVDARNPDSDGDSFLDQNEVFHRYDPAEPTPALLRFSDSIQVYEHDGVVPFEILVPQSWIIQPPRVTGQGIERVDEIVDGIQIRTTTRALIKLEFYDKGDMDVRDWMVDYLEFAGIDESVNLYTTKEGYSGYETGNNRVVVIELANHFLLAEYDLDDDRTIEYLTTFKMILNSFDLDSSYDSL